MNDNPGALGRAINDVFSRGAIADLLANGRCEAFDRAVRQFDIALTLPGPKTYRDYFSMFHTYLDHRYRNEYYLKNALLCCLPLYHNALMAMSEVHVRKSIADVVTFNGVGDGTVYEIKSDLDGLDRLADQLDDYYSAFGRVIVVVDSDKMLKRVKDKLDGLGDMGKAAGILIQGRDCRSATAYTDRLEYREIFRLMRKKERENVLLACRGEVPEAPPAFHFRACLERFEDIPILEAQRSAFKELGKRERLTSKDYLRIPRELMAAVHLSGLSPRKMKRLADLLASEYRVADDA
jgi:hypothetical protein